MIVCVFMINAEVTKNNTENTMSLLRRFTKKVQGSGTLKHVRKIRYQQRALSAFTKKKNKLNKLEMKSKVDNLIKLGKESQIKALKK